MKKQLYFAYGSNMSVVRLNSRVSTTRIVGVARLDGHRLEFHKIGDDGSGKCDIASTSNTKDIVYGAVYELSTLQLEIMDRFEDLGKGYGKKEVFITLPDMQEIYAFTYYALRTDNSLKPYSWYKEHVMRGAQEHNLPLDYIEKINKVDEIQDLDLKRHEEELQIYN